MTPADVKRAAMTSGIVVQPTTKVEANQYSVQTITPTGDDESNAESASEKAAVPTFLNSTVFFLFDPKGGLSTVVAQADPGKCKAGEVQKLFGRANKKAEGPPGMDTANWHLRSGDYVSALLLSATPGSPGMASCQVTQSRHPIP